MNAHGPNRRPLPTEFAEYYGRYIGLVPDGNVVQLMQDQIPDFRAVLDRIPEEASRVLHEPYTWTIRQAVGHLIDVERVFAYRALRFASGDARSIIGMEQNEWVENTDYETPSLRDLTDELESCRQANLHFFRRLPDEAWDRGGEADGNAVTVRALAWIMVGHITHHLGIIDSRVPA